MESKFSTNYPIKEKGRQISKHFTQNKHSKMNQNKMEQKEEDKQKEKLFPLLIHDSKKILSLKDPKENSNISLDDSLSSIANKMKEEMKTYKTVFKKLEGKFNLMKERLNSKKKENEEILKYFQSLISSFKFSQNALD
ncbi:MAG: hypothetical protein MJ252_25315, partial [archaeon]|nr:hypothetical protein [archaeon]